MRNNTRTGETGNRTERRSSGGSSSSGRPLGVTIIAVLGIVGGVFAGLLSLTFLQYGTVGVVGTFVLGGLAAAEIYVMVGLLSMQRWAYTWALVLNGVGIVVDLFRANLVGILIGLVIVGYLVSKSDRFR